jgi:hypothetical protein
MPAKVEIVTTLQHMIADFSELEKAPGFKAIGKLEQVLADAYEASQAIVHVITGDLKMSGVPHTSYSGSEWSGGIDYARHPGIFELALGNTPSIDHPEGQHGAFLEEAVEPFSHKIGDIVEEIFQEAMGHG